MSELKFNVATDKEHEIKLESSLIFAEWQNAVAYAGQTATFEIGTAFVGLGAKIKITGKSENGKKLGTIDDKIKNNKYIGHFDIPEDIDLGDEIYFEVELPKNGLEGESSRIPVYPAPKVSNMKWSAKEARRGDILTLTADIKGLYSGTEVMVKIYEYDEDGAHDLITELPAEIKDDKIEIMWEYEYHEDTDEIASQEEMERYGGNYNPPEYFFAIKIGETEFGLEQESGILVFKDYIEIELKNDAGQPLAEEDYIVYLPDGSKKEGTLDKNGYARIDNVPPGAISIEIAGFKNLLMYE